MTRNEMVEALYHEMKDVLAPGSAKALAERVMKFVEANGLPVEVAVVADTVVVNVTELPEDPVAEVTATVVKAEKAKKAKKTEE